MLYLRSDLPSKPHPLDLVNNNRIRNRRLNKPHKLSPQRPKPDRVSLVFTMKK